MVVSYGGGWLTREIMLRAKARGAATVFPLHNLRYHDPATFVDVDAVLVAENQPLVAIEAMINGVPVLGSNRGGVPETLGEAGSILPIPAHVTPSSQSLPTPEETAPWVDAILELWDSPDLYEQHSRRALIEAHRWSSETVEPLYERLFATLTRAQRSRRTWGSCGAAHSRYDLTGKPGGVLFA